MKSILILCATVLVLSAVSCGPGLPATTEQEDTLSIDSVVADTDTVVVVDSLG